jgi:hypothetical protein
VMLKKDLFQRVLQREEPNNGTYTP